LPTTDCGGEALNVLAMISLEGIDEVGFMRWIGEVEGRIFNEENRKLS
jgi:hypothetical protein